MLSLQGHSSRGIPDESVRMHLDSNPKFSRKTGFVLQAVKNMQRFIEEKLSLHNIQAKGTSQTWM